MRFRDICTVWDRIWFEPTSPAPLCLFRAVYGLLVLLSCLLVAGDLLTWFGPAGVISIETVKHYENLPRFSLLFLVPPTDTYVWLLFALLILAALFVMLGLFTRVSCIVLFLCLVSFAHRNPAVMNSGDTFCRIISFILIFAPAGKMFSLDSWLARKSKKAESPWEIRCSPWAQRLLQFEVGLVYCQTFWAKIIGDTWCNGTAVYYSSRLEEFWKLPVPYVFDNMWSCQLITWSTLTLELVLWTCIWIREVRYWVILAAIIMHLSIDWAMNIPLFEYFMIAPLITFVYPEDLKNCLQGIRQRIGKWAIQSTNSSA